MPSRYVNLVPKQNKKKDAHKSADIIRYILVKTVPSVKVSSTLLAVHLMIYSPGLHKTYKDPLKDYGSNRKQLTHKTA